MNKYPSRYSNGKEVSAAQYITELICENKAKIDGVDLGYRFWTNKKWERFYRDQIATANKLLSKYNEIAIIKAIKNTKSQKIYSLRAPHLIAIIKNEEELVKEQNKKIINKYDRSEEKTFKQNVTTKNKLSRLKELE
jgi:hypothetical protein